MHTQLNAAQITALRTAGLLPVNDEAPVVTTTTVVSTVVGLNSTTVIAQLHAIPDGTKAVNGVPLLRVKTIKGVRGVFWKGEGRGHKLPSVGTKKITNGGKLYRGRGQFTGMFFNKISELS